MASGWETFGNVLGGGIDRTGAFETGRLRTAQTESALQLARERQLSNVAAEKQAKALDEAAAAMAAAGIDPKQAQLLQNIAIGGYGSDFSAGMTGLKTQQEMGFRDTLANPEAPLGEQFAAGQGVKGEVLPRYKVDGGVAQDLLGEELGLFATPVGESTIAANEALVDLRNTQAGDPDYATVSGGGSGGTSGPAGVKVPTGYVANPAYDPTRPIAEGNYPLIKATPPDTGSREHQMNQRMVRSAAQIVPDISNLLTMPASASLGIIGTGSAPGASMLQSSVDALRNTLTADVARAYESQTGEIAKAMAFIESNGFVPNQAQLDLAFNSYSIRTGDTGFDVLRKFANLRQNLEQFNLVQQADNRVPQDIRVLLNELTEITRRSVPFTVQQVNALQFSPDKTRTMADLMRESGFNPDVNAGASARGSTAPAAPATPTSSASPAADDGWIDLGNGVRVREKRGP